jgi:hypothetical protein
MKLTVIHSHQERCGVREYGLELDRWLMEGGAQLRGTDYDRLGHDIPSMPEGSGLLVHFEPGLVQGPYLNHYLILARERRAKVVFCCHWYDADRMLEYEETVDRFVLHRDYPKKHDKHAIIPLGCPVYEAMDPAPLRSKFGLPNGKVVFGTIGFLTGWKRIPEVVLAMAHAMMPHLGSAYLMVHTPRPFNTNDAERQEPEIRQIVANHPAGRNIRFTTDFLPKEETLDLARACDLGFFFHPFHTGSVSAATKQFVAARRPLHVTGSTHSFDLQGGILRTDWNLDAFAKATVELAVNETQRKALENGMQAEYERLNMRAVARSYLNLFGGLGVAG